ncbi:hypothetical protein EG68_06197 [Paragonimus skrjabini miyazakii]|uniref:AAA+ ATPase domain-containing protein n=1 Tax=Paragonimus skrjabini miyazakii TaxID=59628 RepID=A0A8S9YR70_9TREM|nr:hypothetical protein EG68_06197 [Paragonimus skrjabini miyazakii]
MERLLAVVSRDASLPYEFCLTSASVLRPFHIRWPTMASILTVSAASSSTSDPLHTSGCPMEELSELLRRGVSLDPIIGRFRAWWDTMKFSTSSEANTGIPWPTYIPEDAYGERMRIDYVRLLQLIVSLVGIGLSLRLMFYLIEQINPTAKEKRLARKRAQQMFTQLGLKTMPTLTDYEVGIAVNLVDTRVLSTEWNSIGGLDEVIDAIQQSVIEPFQQVPLVPYYSRLLRPPKGVLLFGPPGCGKTMLARAMARAANAYFINLQISALVNMWYGETQKYVEATFSLAHKLQPSIIFIDELDSFLTTRSYTDNESTRMIKTQFMALWDGLLTEESTRILIVGATNRPEDLDQAILRRLPFKVSVPMPNVDQRVRILSICLHGEPMAIGLSERDIREIATRTEGLSGSDLNELCREAAFCCYRLEKSRDSPRLRREHFFTALQKFLSNRVATQAPRRELQLPLD